jgi:hypothetical protein
MAKIVVHRTIPNLVLKKRKLKREDPGQCRPGHLVYPLSGRCPFNHDRLYEDGQKEAYKKAAIATIRKLHVLNNEPIIKALNDLRRYEEYLIRENNLTPEDVK